MKSVMLAPNEKIELSQIPTWPMLASRKFDGNRLLVYCGSLLSRSLKPQPNKNLPEFLCELIEYSKVNELIFDTEILSPTLSFTELQSIMRSFDKELPGDLTVNVFDILTLTEWNQCTEPKFQDRIIVYESVISLVNFAHVEPVQQILVNNPQETLEFYTKCVQDGYEGIMLRHPNSRYKHGRATLKENLIYKFKSWLTVDVQIVGFEQGKRMKEEVQNSDRPRDIMGHLERPHTQDSFELVEEIGCILVKDSNGIISGVRPAKDYEGPEITWKNREQFLGKFVEVRSMAVGVKDKIRIGHLTRFRPDLD